VPAFKNVDNIFLTKVETAEKKARNARHKAMALNKNALQNFFCCSAF